MARSPDAVRRWLGSSCLAISAGMLIIGVTWLKDQLPPRAFICYWLTCFLFTGLTLFIALLDLRAVRLRSRREQGELLQNALRNLAQEERQPKDAPETPEQPGPVDE
jgi:hypothetical protein